ncbi:hypothetical protein GCM10010517_46670 [Streptosporangium fragile]|uniref:Uncharacterized protein n=1 Tax=Streptosporangium fragile TaxID=46186 RepID=A0ABP6IJR8_9ACTN
MRARDYVPAGEAHAAAGDHRVAFERYEREHRGTGRRGARDLGPYHPGRAADRFDP